MEKCYLKILNTLIKLLHLLMYNHKLISFYTFYHENQSEYLNILKYVNPKMNF